MLSEVDLKSENNEESEFKSVSENDVVLNKIIEFLKNG